MRCSLSQVLSPCGFGDIVCGRATEWASNGTELCHQAGFSVPLNEHSYQDAGDPICYGGKPSLDSIAESWRTTPSGKPQKDDNIGLFEEFCRWISETPFSERVSWAVGGMVLTAGLLFIRSVFLAYSLPVQFISKTRFLFPSFLFFFFLLELYDLVHTTICN